MKLNEIKIFGFGKFKEKSLTFGEGLNLVIGPNEAGKSTVQSAIYCAFFGKPSDYLYWGEAGRPCKIDLTYEAEGSTFKLARDLGNKALVDLNSVEPGAAGYTNKSQINKILAAHLGIGDEKIFENTIFIRAEELQPLPGADDAKRIKDRIEALLTGSRKVPVSKALRYLDAAYKDIAGKVNEKGEGGQVGDIRAKLNELAQDLSREKGAERRLSELRAELENTQSLLAEKERQQNNLLPLFQAAKFQDQLMKLAQKRRNLSEKVEQIEDMEAKKTALNEELIGLKLDGLPADIDKTLPLWDQSLKDKQSAMDSVEESSGSARGFALKVPVLAGGTSLLLCGLLIMSLFHNSIGIIFLAPGLAAIVWSVLAGMGSSKIDGKAQKNRQDQIAIDDLISKIQSVLHMSGSPDAAELNNKLAMRIKIQTELRIITEKMGLLLSEGSLEDLKAKRREVLDEEAKIEAKLDEPAKQTLAAIPREQILAKQRLSERLASEIGALKEERSRLKGRRQEMEKETGSAEIEDDMIYLQSRFEEARRKARALSLAQDNLRDATGELASEIVPKITARAQDYFSRFVPGTERLLGLDESLSLTMGPDSKNTIDFLSTATRDQAFFALRLAISQLICRDTVPPLIMDDPFAYFDEQRLGRARKILSDISAEQQVILFSHDNLYRGWPGHLIELSD